jgi:hypothetical protein
MPLLINQFGTTDNTLRDTDYYGTSTGTNDNDNGSYVGNLFCTITGLVGQYIKYDFANSASNWINIYNPASTNLNTIPIRRIPVPFSSSFIGCYSNTHNAFIGFVLSGATTGVYAIDLRIGGSLQIGQVTNNGSNCIADATSCAWDGTNLHVYSRADHKVHVFNIVSGNELRTYNAPFFNRTYSMAYDFAGSIYFSSWSNAANNIQAHVAKIAVGTGGANAEGTILSAYSMAEYLVTPYALRNTFVAWDGYQLITHRQGTATFERYDTTQTPTTIVISPSPARVPADGSNASVIVHALDQLGQPVAGVNVTLAISNGTGNPVFGSIVAPATKVTDSTGAAVFTYKSSTGVSGIDYLTATAVY